MLENNQTIKRLRGVFEKIPPNESRNLYILWLITLLLSEGAIALDG